MMSRVKNGIVAGLTATVIVAAVEAINMYVLKMFDPFPLIVAKMFGLPGNAAAGWALHILFGIVVLGGAFGLLYDRLPTKVAMAKGIAFAVGAWVVLMIYATMIVPGQRILPSGGFEGMAWMLITHAIYGAVLGATFDRLLKRDKAHIHPVGAAPAH